MKPVICKEDENFLVLMKPSGWITNTSSTTGDSPVLQDWIKKNLNFPISNADEYRSGVVHRLDKETSGLVIIAKNEKAFRDLQKQFKNRNVQKTYITLVHGKVSPEEGSVDAPTGRLPWNRERFGVFPGGKHAFTKYKVIEYLKKDKDLYSLLEVYPKTGRTHQIRVHMKYLNHPVVADSFYAGRKTARNDRKWCPRLFLHAQKISFIDPGNRKTINVSSKLPEDLNGAKDRLDNE
ncbi:RluA family pseudouridine synthase [Candidatus Woesebacteria bacterium]|nr:RluA family pseudouridine synthase [Candidatus Woesebacteria bacterium]